MRTQPSFASRLGAVLTLTGLAAFNTSAATLEIDHAVAKKELEKRVFSQQGRAYLSGGPNDDCKYSYLENPDVGARSGRLLLRAHFSGRLGTTAFGPCVGPSDAFWVVATAEPYVHGEVIGLRDVVIEEAGSDLFREAVKAYLSRELEDGLETDVGQMIRQELGRGNAESGSVTSLERLNLQRVTVTPQGIRIDVDLGVRVRTDP